MRWVTENEMVGWNHQLNGREFEQTPGGSIGQGSLVCCSSWGHRVRHDLATEQQQQKLNNIACCGGNDIRVMALEDTLPRMVARKK